MHNKQEFMKLASDFKDCRAVLVALGDENRLHCRSCESVFPRQIKISEIMTDFVEKIG